MMHETMMPFGMGYGFMGVGWLFQLLIVLFFVLVVWWLVRNASSFGFRTDKGEKAIDILKKRLATGEINTKEYERLKREIE